MRMMFLKKPFRASGKEAKNRLKDVILNDRDCISQSKTVEKLRKELTDILYKYSDAAYPIPTVSITKNGGGFDIAAQIKQLG